ncbi:hypothetical protein [Brachybacterium saurashtrense]|uniref:Uncharacterized protein n=1 Tax=Brachybacterium saurashtrense TaxID=556288 RepID=A0A345YSR2_9MICO|nr:hypothetical protein [Brachybacterium saurashtrense]AXK46964.1 hypothetical protein DWV08_15935 [Brachybacterium saurashtrense]RRR22679.1 hypothetical protein DXU92_10555 [Brachybacterium saurashtrense]
MSAAGLEHEGEQLQRLAAALLDAADPGASAVRVAAAFLPHRDTWAARILRTDAAGAHEGGDAVLEAGSRLAEQLDALQEAAAAQSQAFVSCRVVVTRSAEDGQRVSVDCALNHDRDPGSLNGLGGVDAEYARRLAARVGAERMPAWVRALLEDGAAPGATGGARA